MKNQLTINQRVKLVLDTLEFDPQQFARKVGVSSGALINVIDNEEDPSYALLRNICTVFPVSQEWLILGTGKPWTVDNLSKFKSGSKNEEAHHAVNKEINDRFREIRNNQNLSQTVFAAEIGVTRDVISNVESYRSSPSIHMLVSVHKKFGINPYWLMYGDKPMYVSKKG